MVLKVTFQEQSSKQSLCKVSSEAAVRQMFFKSGVPQKFRIGKASTLESLLNKIKGMKVSKFMKERLQQRCFPVIIAKFLRTCFL